VGENGGGSEIHMENDRDVFIVTVAECLNATTLEWHFIAAETVG